MFRREPIPPNTLASEDFKKTLETSEKIHQAIIYERYRNTIDFILNNSKLNYDKSRLIIDYGEVLLEYIKAIEPEKYKIKYNELQEKENSKKED